jgi:hypothetical protein
MNSLFPPKVSPRGMTEDANSLGATRHIYNSGPVALGALGPE